MCEAARRPAAALVIPEGARDPKDPPLGTTLRRRWPHAKLGRGWLGSANGSEHRECRSATQDQARPRESPPRQGKSEFEVHFYSNSEHWGGQSVVADLLRTASILDRSPNPIEESESPILEPPWTH